jgi:hypothetical protein
MVIDLNKQIKEDQARWALVEDAAAKNDIPLFWRLYLAYLKASPPISKSRMLIIKMTQATVDAYFPPDKECIVNEILSRVCENGTKSCEVKHNV